MERIAIDADALFRAATALGYKMVVYYLDREDGKIITRQMERRGDSSRGGPGDLGDPTNLQSLRPKAGPPLPVQKKADLFKEGPEILKKRKDPFATDFWKKDTGPKPDLFGEGPAKPVGPPKGFLFKDDASSAAEVTAAGNATNGQTPAAEVKPPEAAAKTNGHAAGKPAPTVDDAPDELEGGRCIRVRTITDATQWDWMAAFAKECGDPEIRDKLREAMKKSDQPQRGFFQVLSRYGRLRDQWERFYRRRALDVAEEWLKEIGIEYELVEQHPSIERPF